MKDTMLEVKTIDEGISISMQGNGIKLAKISSEVAVALFKNIEKMKPFSLDKSAIRATQYTMLTQILEECDIDLDAFVKAYKETKPKREEAKAMSELPDIVKELSKLKDLLGGLGKETEGSTKFESVDDLMEDMRKKFGKNEDK